MLRGLALEHRGEAVHRDQYGTPPSGNAGVEQLGDARVVGRKNLAAAHLALGRWNGRVARDRGQLADLGDRGGPAGFPVAIDDEPRIGLQNRGGVERVGQLFGHPGDADIPGDVAQELAPRQAKSLPAGAGSRARHGRQSEKIAERPACRNTRTGAGSPASMRRSAGSGISRLRRSERRSRPRSIRRRPAARRA